MAIIVSVCLTGNMITRVAHIYRASDGIYPAECCTLRIKRIHDMFIQFPHVLEGLSLVVMLAVKFLHDY